MSAPRRMSLVVVLFSAVFGATAAAAAFQQQPPSRLGQGHFWHRRRRRHCQAARKMSVQAEVFVLSYDGAVVQSGHLRARQSIELALETWPPLQDVLSYFDDGPHKKEQQQEAEDEEEEEDESAAARTRTYPSWLLQKMTDLSPVVQSVSEGALLARLILEEQLLDVGSNGLPQSRGWGKYGSKYHPKASRLDERARHFQLDANRRNPQRQSRPLTVGEIAANWGSNGAELRETTRVKYALQNDDNDNDDNKNHQRLDPLPILQSNARRLFSNVEDPTLPPLHFVMHDILSSTSASPASEMVVLVPETALLPEAQAVLSEFPHVSLLVAHHPVPIMKRLLEQHCDQQVVLLHRSLEVLQDAARQFFHPQYGQMPLLSLGLPTWDSTFVTPDSCLEAEMDPHIRLVTQQEALEKMTARIIAATPRDAASKGGNLQ